MEPPARMTWQGDCMRFFDKMKAMCRQQGKMGRILLWCAVFVVCLFFSVMTLKMAGNKEQEHALTNVFDLGSDVFEIESGGILQLTFVGQGKSAGGMGSFYVQPFKDRKASGNVIFRLYNDSTGEQMLEMTQTIAKMPVKKEAAQWIEIIDDEGYYHLKSGERYRIEILNESEKGSVYFLGNAEIQSGKLVVNGERQRGVLNLEVFRRPLYRPSVLLLLLVLLTDVTALLGLALVLFTDVKTEMLYLILAIGFGIVTLFDLTPIYGFDMRFQYDSAYAVSNRMLGIEDIVYTPSVTDPEAQVLSYYRRSCDDYSQYQFYYDNEVSANYTDMKVGLRYPFATAEGKELELVQTHLGFIGEQLYLYIPQALGFTIARLMGVGMMPMLQFARAITYAIFVAVMYYSIRCMPFGKRIYLILAMTPTVFIQTVSITRDAMIITMCFFVIAKCLQMAYRDEKPKTWEWLVVLVVSMLLAPCKMIYLPVSFFWLLVLYRHYILEQKPHWGKLMIRIALFALPILCFFVLTNLTSISNLSQPEKDSVYGTASYTLSYILTHIPEALFVAANTLRTELGSYLENAIQLWDIRLGSSAGITLLVTVLLVIEAAYICENRRKVNPLERSFLFLVALGVFALVSLAAMQWTPMDSDVIVGLQGRYLTPILPLLCMSCINNRVVRVTGNSEVFVKACCCVYPVFYLMNMYLWTINT